ncbi:hypothetical protein, partial [Geobacillus subterraneus]|uniref:hypothetical protein n=1 Tax=Geobacillus subterraneus TaxID=129338 RepID=UPI001C871BD6
GQFIQLTPPNHTKRAFFIQVPGKTSNRNAPFVEVSRRREDLSPNLELKDWGGTNGKKKESKDSF